jgi:hypothetical protein
MEQNAGQDHFMKESFFEESYMGEANVECARARVRALAHQRTHTTAECR